MYLLASDLLALWVLLGLLGFFGLIVLGVMIAKNKINFLKIKKPEIDEKEAAKEELDRILVPIDDEEIQKQMDEATKNDEFHQ